jgi:hypothetical protein
MVSRSCDSFDRICDEYSTGTRKDFVCCTSRIGDMSSVLTMDDSVFTLDGRCWT